MQNCSNSINESKIHLHKIETEIELKLKLKLMKLTHSVFRVLSLHKVTHCRGRCYLFGQIDLVNM